MPPLQRKIEYIGDMNLGMCPVVNSPFLTTTASVSLLLPGFCVHFSTSLIQYLSVHPKHLCISYICEAHCLEIISNALETHTHTLFFAPGQSIKISKMF